MNAASAMPAWRRFRPVPAGRARTRPPPGPRRESSGSGLRPMRRNTAITYECRRRRLSYRIALPLRSVGSCSVDEAVVPKVEQGRPWHLYVAAVRRRDAVYRHIDYVERRLANTAPAKGPVSARAWAVDADAKLEVHGRRGRPRAAEVRVKLMRRTAKLKLLAGPDEGAP